MKINRRQLRNYLEKVLNEETSKKVDSKYGKRINHGPDIKTPLMEFMNQLAQTGFKHSPVGLALVIHSRGDAIIDMVEKGEMDKAIDIFKSAYNAL